jgi:hypothetical protein
VKTKPPTIVLDLPLPPPTSTPGDSRYCEWLTTAGHAIIESRAKPIVGSVAVKACVPVGERLSLERIAARLVDALVAHGVVEVGAMADLAMRRDITIEEGRIKVEVRRTKPPEARLRAAARANVAQAVRARWAAARAKKFSNEETHHGAQNDGPGHDDAQSHQEHRARQADQNITLARTRVDALE